MKLSNTLIIAIACMGLAVAMDPSVPATGSLDEFFESAFMNHQDLSPFLNSVDALSRISDTTLVQALVYATEENEEMATRMGGNLQILKRIVIALSEAQELTVPEAHLLHSLMEHEQLLLSLEPMILDEILRQLINNHHTEALAPVFSNPAVASRIFPKQVLQYIAYAAQQGDMKALNFFFGADLTPRILTVDLLSQLLKFLVRIKSTISISNLLKNHNAFNRIPDVAWENCASMT